MKLFGMEALNDMAPVITQQLNRCGRYKKAAVESLSQLLTKMKLLLLLAIVAIGFFSVESLPPFDQACYMMLKAHEPVCGLDVSTSPHAMYLGEFYNLEYMECFNRFAGYDFQYVGEGLCPPGPY